MNSRRRRFRSDSIGSFWHCSPIHSSSFSSNVSGPIDGNRRHFVPNGNSTSSTTSSTISWSAWFSCSPRHFRRASSAGRSTVILPIYLLGFAESAINAYVVWVGIQAVLIHANTSISFGPFGLGQRFRADGEQGSGRSLILGNGRGDWNRTSDLLAPNEARYQAAPRPDRSPRRTLRTRLRKPPSGWARIGTRLVPERVARAALLRHSRSTRDEAPTVSARLLSIRIA